MCFAGLAGLVIPIEKRYLLSVLYNYLLELRGALKACTHQVIARQEQEEEEELVKSGRRAKNLK